MRLVVELDTIVQALPTRTSVFSFLSNTRSNVRGEVVIVVAVQVKL